MNRTRTRLAVGALALLTLAACRTNTEANETAVHVTGYDIIPTSAKVKDCVDPATNKYIGFGDKAYRYPVGQRTYKFDSGDKADHAPVEIVTKDNVTMTLTGVLTFYLDTDCATLMKFHTEIGSKVWNGKHAYFNDGEDGWKSMLDVYLGNTLKNVLSDFAAPYDSTRLYGYADIRRQLQSVVAREMPKQVEALAHGPYFLNFTVSLNKPEAPDKIKDALEEHTRQEQLRAAQVAANATDVEKYKTLANCKKAGLSESTCAFVYAVNSGHVEAVPQGSVVSVTPKQ